MTRTFRAPRAYDPSYSLLGRAVRACAEDRLRSEALFIVLLTGLALLLLLSHYLGWTIVKPIVTENRSWQLLFWGGQVASVLALAGVGLVGFRPSVRVSCTSKAVTFQQGQQTCRLPLGSIQKIETISSETYYRHYRRYRAARLFVSALPDKLLLFHHADGPVIVGLEDSDRSALRDVLQTHRAADSQPVAKGHS